MSKEASPGPRNKNGSFGIAERNCIPTGAVKSGESRKGHSFFRIGDIDQSRRRLKDPFEMRWERPCVLEKFWVEDPTDVFPRNCECRAIHEMRGLEPAICLTASGRYQHADRLISTVTQTHSWSIRQHVYHLYSHPLLSPPAISKEIV